MSKDYSKQLVKDYKYWTLSVHSNQCYLGRCVVWCKRNDALDMADATPDEQKELFIILSELRSALTKAFSPDWFNYGFLGNEMRHLHGHIVPRYSKPVTFKGVDFEDKLYGKHYRSDHAFKIPDEILFAIRDEIKKNI
ncbi:MAG: HIT domain-containing protein [Patescibacteria group bacterium]